MSCQYPALPTAREDSHADLELLRPYAERLAQVEIALERHGEILHDVQTKLQHILARERVPNGSVSATSPEGQSIRNLDAFTPRTNGDNTDDVQFLIPEEHCTSTTWLLSLPTLQRLLGDYPERFFHSLERSKPVPLVAACDEDASIALRESDTELLDLYFAGPHCHYPLFTTSELDNMRSMPGTNDRPGAAHAVVLLVYALGKYIRG